MTSKKKYIINKPKKRNSTFLVISELSRMSSPFITIRFAKSFKI